MLAISCTEVVDDRIVYTLVGDVTTIHLRRLAQIINSTRTHGRTVCFDMSAVMILDRDTTFFFTEGPGRLAIFIDFSPPLDELRL